MRKVILVAAVIVAAWSAPAQARPAGCPSLWCGCWGAIQLGYSVAQAKAKGLWRARTWAAVFPRTSLAPGMWAVFARGRGGGHVGKIVAVHGGSITMISGNDGNRVRTRDRSLRGLIAVVNPYSSYAASSPKPGARPWRAAKIRVAKRGRYKHRVLVERRHPPRVVPRLYAHAAS